MKIKNRIKVYKIEEDYIPKTSILGISGTSFGVQLGACGQRLATIIYRGKENVAFKVWSDINLEDIVHPEEIMSWIITNLDPLLISPSHVRRTTVILLNQLNRDIHG